FWGLSVGADFYALGEPAVEVARYLGWLNGILAVFNMLPGFPLDGGRIFRSTVWHFTDDLEKATRWATRGGRVVGYLLIGLGLFELFMGQLVGGLWSAFIGWFLSNAADASWRQFLARQTLSRIPVSRVMVRDPVTLPSDMSVDRAVEACFQRRPHSAYPVTRDGRLVGMISLDHVKDLDRGRWGDVTVHDLMRPIDSVPTVAPQQSLDEVISGLKMDEHSRILVVQDGVLLGVVTLGDI
ncbi:MAG: CBS domain-containing protein, partial [Gemmatimonadota bacterium]